MLATVLSYWNMASYCKIDVCFYHYFENFLPVVFSRFCFPCRRADCLSDLFWCQSDQLFVSMVRLMVNSHASRYMGRRGRAELMDGNEARLLCKWSFSILITDSVAFSPVHAPSLCVLHPPVQRSKVSGVLAAVDKYGLMLLLAFYSPCAIANETCPSHVDTVKALLTSRQAPATLILSSMWNVPLPSCMFPHSPCVLLSLVFFVRWHCWCWIPIKETLQYVHAWFSASPLADN